MVLAQASLPRCLPLQECMQVTLDYEAVPPCRQLESKRCCSPGRPGRQQHWGRLLSLLQGCLSSAAPCRGLGGGLCGLAVACGEVRLVLCGST